MGMMQKHSLVCSCVSEAYTRGIPTSVLWDSGPWAPETDRPEKQTWGWAGAFARLICETGIPKLVQRKGVGPDAGF